MAKAVGVELAKYRYGLVVGGWHGVDYLVTESFLNELSSHSLDPRDYLIQVLPRIVNSSFIKGILLGHAMGGESGSNRRALRTR